MDWQPYRACCLRPAADADVAYCPECGHALLRCMAFAECRGLVSPLEACSQCVAPTLMIDAGAVVQSKTGERVSVPLILRNDAPAGRSIWVKRIVKWDGRVNEPLALTWEQLDAGTERRFTLDTPPMAEGGRHTLRVILTLASRYKGVEEEYAFAAGMSIDVSAPDAQQVVQNINLSGAQFQTGGMVHTALNTKGSGGAAAEATRDRRVVALERAEKYELEEGIRGYKSHGVRVPRNVSFAFRGFRPEDTPPSGATLVTGGRFVCGRNSRQPDPTGQSLPSDLSLRVYDRRGALDEAATMAISRHHFDLVVANGRLCVQTRTTRGMEINGQASTAGALVPVGPADKVVPIPGRAEKLALQFSFASAHGVVERIDVMRTPSHSAQ